VGVIFSTSQATATQTIAPLSTSVIYQTSVLTAAAGTAAATASPYFPYATTSYSSATGASAPAAQNSKSGLGVGAIVGIAIGGLAIILIAILVAFLLWRRRRKQPSALPPEPKTTTVQELGANNWRPDGKEVKSMTTTSVMFTPELSAEQAIYAANYEKVPLVPAVSSDPRYPSNQLTPMEPNSVHQLSPSSASTELAAVIPSEVAASTPSEYGPPYNGIPKVDSTLHSHITSPVSELGNAPYEIQHELSASPYMTSYSPGAGHLGSTARELSSSPTLRAAVPYSEPHIPASTGVVAGPVDDEADDAELNRMKAEIEAVRAEKERVLRLQALEERERELSRKIVNRELSKGAGS
jgi:hypothetical protein